MRIIRRLFHSALHPLCRMMRLDSDPFRSILVPEVIFLRDLFNREGHGLRLAGGAVRDLLLGIQPEDLDFATTATPQQMKDLFQKEGIRMLHKKGEAHGTVTVRLADRVNYELTTLRVDVRTDGRHAEVEFTQDWERDAERRDLTINAMFLDLDGNLYDYFDGKSDLEKRIVRFVGNPEKRIREDYLRILRYFRFYGRIAEKPNEHEKDTLEAIRNNAKGLSDIAGERLWIELKKILGGNFAKEMMLKMVDLGVAPYIGLPASPAVSEFAAMCDRSRAMEPHPVTRWVALLHTEEEVMASQVRLKMSKREREMALFILNHRKDPNLENLRSAILDAKQKTSDVHDWSCEVLKYCGKCSLWSELSDWQVPKFPLSGHLLLEMGYPPGPPMNALLTKLKKQWVASNYTSTKEDLLHSLPEK